MNISLFVAAEGAPEPAAPEPAPDPDPQPTRSQTRAGTGSGTHSRVARCSAGACRFDSHFDGTIFRIVLVG